MRLIAVRRDGSPASEIPRERTMEEVCRALADLYGRAGHEPPWIGYLAEEGGVVVGSCAFKSAPLNDRVEIAYFTFPGHEGKGYATRMVRQLVAMALQERPEVTITAHTLPAQSASTVILVKLGFVKTGEGQDPDDGTVWVWELKGGAPRLADRCP